MFPGDFNQERKSAGTLITFVTVMTTYTTLSFKLDNMHMSEAPQHAVEGDMTFLWKFNGSF